MSIVVITYTPTTDVASNDDGGVCFDVYVCYWLCVWVANNVFGGEVGQRTGSE